MGDEAWADDDVFEDVDVGSIDLQIGHQCGLTAPQLGFHRYRRAHDIINRSHFPEHGFER
jgi:hypothetical protein